MIAGAGARGRGAGRPAELDMVPMMNLFTVLVPVLLLAAVFARITVLDLEIPPRGSGESGGASATAATPLDLVVVVAPEGITVGGSGGFLPSILREEEGIDVARLASLLASVRAAHPRERRVTVAAAPGIPYEEVVAVMDLCRDAGFSAIALAALHDGEGRVEGGGR